MDVEEVDDCKSLYNPSSFSSSLSVLLADSLLTALRLRTACNGWQSLFSRRHLHCFSMTFYTQSASSTSYLSHLTPMPLPKTHFALARAHVEQARPYGVGVPCVGAASGSMFAAVRFVYCLFKQGKDLRSG